MNMKHPTIHSHGLEGINPRKGFAGAAATPLNVRPAATQHSKVELQAQKWVAQTFFGTLLKQMRNSPFRSPLFEGGRGGEAFQSLYDQRLAEHMARGAGHKLVDAIARKIEARNAYAKSSRSPRQGRGAVDQPQRGGAHVPPALRA